MKKIIPMILLLSFSLPAMAYEHWVCTLNDGAKWSWILDEDTDILSWEPSGRVEQPRASDETITYFISNNKFRYRRTQVKNGLVIFELSRVMSRIDGRLSDSDNAEVGRCGRIRTPF
jgi:hypothetical protein